MSSASVATESSFSANASAKSYLESLLNRQLLVHTKDDRMFSGDFKCTDNDRNIILSQAFEYRYPSTSAVSTAMASAEGTNVKVNMTSRFMGLVVVPGQYITKIELKG